MIFSCFCLSEKKFEFQTGGWQPETNTAWKWSEIKCSRDSSTENNREAAGEGMSVSVQKKLNGS